MSLPRPLQVAALGAVLALGACWSSAPPRSGFLGDYSQLKPRPDDPDSLVYVSEGFDVAPYTALLIAPIEVHPFSMEIEREATPEKLAWLADEFHDVLLAAVSPQRKVVVRAGRGVLRIRAALTDVEPASGEDGKDQGQVTMEVEFADGVTGERLAAGVLRQRGVPDDLGKFTRWGQASDSFLAWGKRLVAFLDEHDSSKAGGPPPDGDAADGSAAEGDAAEGDAPATEEPATDVEEAPAADDGS